MGLGEVEDKFRLRGCVSEPRVLKQTPASFEPPEPAAQWLGQEDLDSKARQNGEALQFPALPAQLRGWAEKPRHPA